MTAVERAARWLRAAVLGAKFRQTLERNEHAAAELDAVVRKVLQK